MLRTIAATLGIVMLGAGLIGYFLAPARPWERALLLAGALCLISPGVMTDVIGLGCLVATVLSQRARRAREAAVGGRSAVS